MLILFWNKKGVILEYYIETVVTVTSTPSSNMLAINLAKHSGVKDEVFDFRCTTNIAA